MEKYHTQQHRCTDSGCVRQCDCAGIITHGVGGLSVNAHPTGNQQQLLLSVSLFFSLAVVAAGTSFHTLCLALSTIRCCPSSRKTSAFSWLQIMYCELGVDVIIISWDYIWCETRNGIRNMSLSLREGQTLDVYDKKQGDHLPAVYTENKQGYIKGRPSGVVHNSMCFKFRYSIHTL